MKIIIPGDPLQQGRMRHFMMRGQSRCYDPMKKDKDYIKAFLQDYISKHYPKYQFPHCPKVSFYFYCSIPKSMPKKLRWYAERGLLRKRTRPDSDNYVKLYLDCMNEIILEDDAHASIGDADKFFHAEPKTIIYVDECAEILNIPLDDLEHFSESCEWIRAKKDSPNDYRYLAYEGERQSLSLFHPHCKASA
jgi:Holliday junction resolvase RusA-like endonuclease